MRAETAVPTFCASAAAVSPALLTAALLPWFLAGGQAVPTEVVPPAVAPAAVAPGTVTPATVVPAAAGAPAAAPPLPREEPSQPHLWPDDRPDDLQAIPVPPALRHGLLLRAPALQALQAMVRAARSEGLELRVVSAFRSYQRQEQLYRQAVANHGPEQRWVAPPGRSEHQLGTAVDLADGKLTALLDPAFAETPEGRWLGVHAAAFGFVQSYTAGNAEATGYNPEPWHLRWKDGDEDKDADGAAAAEGREDRTP